MAGVSGVQALSVADASGLWVVRTVDKVTYLFDGDAVALRAVEDDTADGVLGQDWWRVMVVFRSLSDFDGDLHVGSEHVFGLYVDDDARAELLFRQPRIASIEPADAADLRGSPPRLHPLPPGVAHTGGRREVVLDDDSGVWAVHGGPESSVMFVDADYGQVLLRHLDPNDSAEKWLGLREVRSGGAGPRGVIRAGTRVVFHAAGLPDGRDSFDTVTAVRHVLGDELATLPARRPRSESHGTARVVLPDGKHVVLEIPGEDSLVFDQDLIDATFRIGLAVPPERRHAKKPRLRLVVGSNAKFLVDGRDIGAKKGLKVVRDGLVCAIDRAVQDRREPRAATESQVDTRGFDDADDVEPNGNATKTHHTAPPHLDAARPADLHVDVEDAAERLEELLDFVGTGRRVVLTRNGSPAAMLIAWSQWCTLNVNRAWAEHAYWSCWDGGTFDHARYAELVTDQPHDGDTPQQSHRNRWRS